jgi:hypothetical protein
MISRANESDWYDGLEAVAAARGTLMWRLARSILNLDVWDYVDASQEAGLTPTER